MDSDDDFQKPCPRRDRKRRNRIRRLLMETVTTVTKKPKRTSQWWVLQPSKVKRDDRFEEKPIGLGVFTTRRVKIKIYFSGGKYTCLTKISRNSIQRDYAVCSDDVNYVVTPTEIDIKTGSLRCCWRINHSTDRPTHRLEWDNTESQSHPHGRAVLIPLRTLEAGEELTFDYNNK